MRLDEFYADPKRASSDEVNFGSSWRTHGEGPWKVVWMEATGEVVAFNEYVDVEHPLVSNGGGSGLDVGTDSFAGAVVGGILYTAAEAGIAALFRPGAPKPHPQLDEVVIIAVEPDLFRLRGALIGWEEHLPEENGLAWLAERVDERPGTEPP